MQFKRLTTLDELKAAQAAGLRVEWCSPHSPGWIIPRERPEEYLREGYGRLRVEVPAQRYPDEAVAKLVEEVEDLLATHPVASVYPDGPCLERYTHDDLTAALAALNNLEPKS